jgi:hypothetical protein
VLRRTRRLLSWGGLLGFVVCWGAAILVPRDDIDFFNPQDFLDTHVLHHEHIFVGLIVLGLVMLVLSIVLARQSNRIDLAELQQ